MQLPRIIVTGASGFIGRHLLEALKETHIVHGMARRSQQRSGAPVHENISWYQVDIGDRPALERALRRAAAGGPIDTVLHLAAHYDFTGEEHPEYWRTNVEGLRNVLDVCREFKPRRFVFSSSVAACEFPRPGEALTEQSPADGDHIYAITKRKGEEMLAEYADSFPSSIVRFAALFSDWCEYAPLYVFLRTWLSDSWNRSMLGGKGESAIPYLHVRDAMRFLLRILGTHRRHEPGEVFLCSPDGSTSHNELFEVATDYDRGTPGRPIHMPKLLCGPGMLVMDLLGRLGGERPFERPWMARYIDKKLTIDARHTRSRLGWAPRNRLNVLRRMPFLLDNFRNDPFEWQRRNHRAMKSVRRPANLQIHGLLSKHEKRINEEFTRRMLADGGERFPSYLKLARDELGWNHTLALKSLMDTIQLRQKTIFSNYCRSLADRRYRSGFGGEEVISALRLMEEVCLDVLGKDPEIEPVRDKLRGCITMTVLLGCDQVEDFFELAHGFDVVPGGEVPDLPEK